MTRPLPLLCSSSPRRAALLEAAGIEFERGPAPDVDETPPPGVASDGAAEALAVRKAVAASRRAPGRVVLAADTTVLADGEILGKPTGPEDAARMLRALSGREHSVVTGVAVALDERVEHGSDRARVAFRALSAAEIERYVASGEPLDKAGAYAIQGGAAGFVARLDGRVDTVVGLPVALVRTLLDRLGLAGFRPAAKAVDGGGRSSRSAGPRGR